MTVAVKKTTIEIISNFKKLGIFNFYMKLEEPDEYGATEEITSGEEIKKLYDNGYLKGDEVWELK